MSKDIVKTEQMPVTALVTLDPAQYVQETFAPFHDRLSVAVTEYEGVTYDIQTKPGMELAKQVRGVFKKIRTEAENARKERKAPILEISKLIDAKYKEIEAGISKHEDLHDQAIKAEEARLAEIEAEAIRIEQERKAAITQAIANIVDAPTSAISMSAAGVSQKIEELRGIQITEEVFGDRNVEAELAQMKAIESLTQLHSAKVAQEAAAAAEQQRQASEQAERAEASRIAGIRSRIDAIERAASNAAMADTSAEIEALISQIDKTVIDATFAEFQDEAEGTKLRVLKAMNRALAMVKAEEVERLAHKQQQALDAQDALAAINGAKPEVAEREATPSGQDQVSEKQSSPTPTPSTYPIPVSVYYPLFEHMANEHGLTLLESDLEEIVRISVLVNDRMHQNADLFEEAA